MMHPADTYTCAWGPCERARVETRCERMCMGPVCACMETLRASTRGDPVSEHAWGPCEQACVGTLRVNTCGAPVRVCVDPSGMDMGVRGSSGHRHGHVQGFGGHAGIQQAQARACRDPAGMTSSSSHVPVSIQCKKKRIHLLYKPSIEQGLE